MSARIIGLCCLLALMSACTRHMPRAGDAARPAGFVLVREYVDSVKTPHGDEYQRVQYGWDYDQKVAIQRISKLDGSLISVDAQPNLTLATTPDELAFAFKLVREHAALKALAARADAQIYGGFILTSAPHAGNLSAANRLCTKGSRCVHVIISGGSEGQEPLAHAIVDLARGQVVDADYRGVAAVMSKIKS